MLQDPPAISRLRRTRRAPGAFRPPAAAEEVSIREILRVLWRRKLLLAAGTLLAMAAAYLAASVVPKEYEAHTVIEPVASASTQGEGLLGSIGSNIASMAGLATATDSRKVESVAILQSEGLAERFIEKNNLLPTLFAKDWDAAHARWKSTKAQPTLWKGNVYFRRYVMSLATDTRTGLATLRLTWRNPEVAAAWANGLVDMVNEYQREQAIEESDEHIGFLTNQAAKTDVLGVKTVIYSLLQSELNKAMLARGNPQYAFKIIDRAIAPEAPSYPNKTIWVLTGAFASVSIALFAAFCVVAWRKE